MRWHCCLIALFATLHSAGMSPAVPPDAAPPPPDQPQIAAASDEAEQAIKSFRVPQGLEVRLFAAEPFEQAGAVAITKVHVQQHNITVAAFKRLTRFGQGGYPFCFVPAGG